jgi:hypothetical protein
MPAPPDEIKERLQRMVASSTEPALDDDAINDLLTLGAIPDEQGRLPTDSTWSGAWDLNFAAAEGWRWKAAAASANFNFATDNNRFDRSQVYAQCVAQADLYANKGALVLRLRSSTFPVEIFTDQAEVVR